MLALTWLGGLLRRRPGRIAAAVAGVAVAVALLASVGTFVSSAKASMTRRAAVRVAVDWQVEAQGNTDPGTVLSAVRATPGVDAVLPVSFAGVSGLEADTGGTTQTTGSGVAVGLPPSYATTFPGELRPLAGSATGVLVAQQTAANLHVSPGDAVRINRAGLPPVSVVVDGVVDLPEADSLFQTVGAQSSARTAPPDNVVLLPDDTWHAAFDPLAAARPDLVRHQVHARLSHRLPADPAAAFTRVSAAARHLEAGLSGGALVGDNLAATLGAARADALYAQVLFVLLGLPGAVLAGLLTATVVAAGADRRQRELALLRARGATPSAMVRLATAEAAFAAAAGGLMGLVAGRLVGSLVFGSASFGATTVTAWAWAAGALAVGSVVALASLALPVWRDARRLSVAAARRSLRSSRRPAWLRLGLDLWVMAAAALIFWLTARGGYALVLAPEGVPTISVSYWSLAAPALAWVGAGLVVWRITEAFVRRGPRLVGTLSRPIGGSLSRVVANSLVRQRARLARAVALFALTVAFAASTAVFTATYRQQVGVDARLSNGADVTVAEAPGAGAGSQLAAQLTAVPGVRSVEPLLHRFAYVGADLQDLFAVRPSTVVAATRLQDAYFSGGSAQSLMARLAARPDGVLVSAETVKDFALAPGDTLRLRLRDTRSGQLREVPFHYVGVAKEFPTAPRDSFLVTNADYVTAQTGDPSVGSFLIDTGGASPPAVAARVRRVVGPTAVVSDVDSSRRVVGSSLTAVDLDGLSRVELGFALVLAVAAAGLVLAANMAQRRRAFAITTALGARPRQLGAFVRTEAAVVAVLGLSAGAVVAAVIAAMLVKVLTGVFDPPPASLAVPFAYLGGLGILALAAATMASEATVRAARRPAPGALRES